MHDTEMYQKDSSNVGCYSRNVEGTSTMEMMGTTGCHVTLQFAETPNPQIRNDIAEMLIDSFVKGRGKE